MIDIKEIDSEIEKLENCSLTYSICEKLASLYTIKEYYDKHYKTRINNVSVNQQTNIPSPSNESRTV